MLARRLFARLFSRPFPRKFPRKFASLSIRNKLLAMVLLPLLVVLPLLGLILLLWGNTAFDRLLITKVRADLAVAQGYFERVLGQVGASTAAVADSHTLHLALAQRQGVGADDANALVALLQRFKQREELDFLNLRAPDGRVLATDSGVPNAADATALPLPLQQLQQEPTPPPGASHTSVEVLAPAQMAGVLSAALRERVPVALVATRNAAPAADARTQESRAMVLLSARAVWSPQGVLLGHVQGGLLLNRNLPFIDHINEIVYPDGSLPFAEWGSKGTATLFLDDVRISTNVRLFGGEQQERAIGTRVSTTVRDAVLARGSTWLGRAFVVNDWYVSGYHPLQNSAGQRVGMLYVGFLETPFTLLKYGALAGIGLVFFGVMIGAAVVSLRWARAIFSPIERMAATMRRVEAGALDARVGGPDDGARASTSHDEIARLATQLDQLLATLQRWNAGLDAKVAERTQQLADAQAQLVRSERLATVGQLTASIAHEVNNPIAVIQGNLDLVRELLPPAAAGTVRAELKLVDEQIERMRLIVTQLLQFARPTEFAGYVESVAPARAVDDCLVLVSHLLARTQISVQRSMQARASVAINRQELQQVLVNLLVNAIHEMEGGGTLTLTTRDVPAGDGAAAQVEIGVADTGPGIPADVLAQLFQPFVTHKKDGTGLGLWISRGIVERYGGDIVAANAPTGRRGAVFTVRLLADTTG